MAVLCIFHAHRLPSAPSLGKLLWEMALCPGMPWVKVSSKQRDLCFVPLVGAHYTASESCFSCGFPSLSWIPEESGSTKEGKGKQVPRGRVKAQSMQDRTGLYLCYCTVFTPALALTQSQERRGDTPFSQQVQKNPTSSVKTSRFLFKFVCDPGSTSPGLLLCSPHSYSIVEWSLKISFHSRTLQKLPRSFLDGGAGQDSSQLMVRLQQEPHKMASLCS